MDDYRDVEERVRKRLEKALKDIVKLERTFPNLDRETLFEAAIDIAEAAIKPLPY